MRSPDTSKLAVVYVRQSSKQQVDNNVYSLPHQLKLIDKAKDAGFPPDRILVIDDDLGKSAKTIAARPGMVKLLAMVEAGEVGCVYSEDITRLTRDIKGIQGLMIAATFEEAKCLLYTQGNYRDFSQESDYLLFGIQSMIQGSQWNVQVKDRVAKRRQKAMEGKAAASVPRGYRVCREGDKRDPGRDRLIIHEPEAKIIRLLAETLLDAGTIRGAALRLDPLRWPDGKPVRWSKLGRVLRSPIYRGHYKFADVLVKDAHPAIIPPEMGDRIDQLLDLNRTTKRRHVTDGLLFCGLLWCVSCDRRIYTARVTRRDVSVRMYRCCQNWQNAKTITHFAITGSLIESIVLADMWQRLDAGMIDQVIATLESQKKDAVESNDFVADQLQIIQRRIDGYMQSLSDPDLPPAVRKLIQQQFADALQEKEAKAAQSPAVKDIDSSIAAYRHLKDPDVWAGMVLAWDAPDAIDFRRQWVRLWIKRIEIETVDGWYQITIRYHSGAAISLQHKKGTTWKGG